MMKQRHKRKRFAAKPHRILKTEDDVWRWWQAALKEKGTAIPSPPVDNTTTLALMVWADDGGAVL